MKTDALDRLDSFPYRHLVRDVMAAPLVTAGRDATAVEAARLMCDGGVSSLVVLAADGRPDGIVTERDLLRAVAVERDSALEGVTVTRLMSSPVVTVDAGAFVYVALGRIARCGIRHLVAVDGRGRAVGMVTARGLLKLRAGDALMLGDAIDDAGTPEALAAVMPHLPGLAERLLDEGVDAPGVAAVISAVYCDLTRRAWELAAADMERDGKGPPPAPYALLVLGSGGRGESLLRPDQDNAIVHEGTAEDDTWFDTAAGRMTAILDGAGLPYCKGGVMASNPAWRRSREEWRDEIARWVRSAAPDALLSAAIFFDAARVAGSEDLAASLRATAAEMVRGSVTFLKAAGLKLDSYAPPIGFFGGIRTEDGRVDLKLHGLLPITTGIRAMALQHGIGATGTTARLDALIAAGAVGTEDGRHLRDGLSCLMRAVLDQQTADIRAGKAPSTHVDPTRLGGRELADLKAAFRAADSLRLIVRDSLTRAAG